MARIIGIISFIKSLLFKSPPGRFTKLTKLIAYRFNNIEYLEQAFTHRSVSSEPRKNYERLEFLGDAVIDIIISRELMRYYADGDEGLLTKKRSALVQQSFLSIIGNTLDIMDYLIVEPNVDLNNEKVVNKQQANLVEALIGAIYLDGGIDSAKNFVNKFWENMINTDEILKKDAKTALQEWSHANLKIAPTYQDVSKEGPPHKPIFKVEVSLPGYESSFGEGESKRKAQQLAAADLLELVKKF